uniref:Paired mesoderm homeobox protein 2-like isoform X3 n=1 Tax=Dermatophagoides pteronyssinus TaxID=6956 RepID=A0A6P6YD80_DERPT|nr:paired mesoderm homeobox protein 2-like isoform X3 [Dermatophagoides pteronyssinus]
MKNKNRIWNGCNDHRRRHHCWLLYTNTNLAQLCRDVLLCIFFFIFIFFILFFFFFWLIDFFPNSNSLVLVFPSERKSDYITEHIKPTKLNINETNRADYVECKMAKINESNSGESNRYSHQQNFNRLSTCGRIWTNNNNNEKRMRTSFQKCQLDLLHRCFKRTHKPNTDEMYHLVQQTQLSKRVLQIWFQNQRSKWTRLMMSRPPIVGPIKVMASKVAAESFSQNIAIIDQKQQ